MLSEAERQRMAQDVAELIRASGESAEIRRGESSGAGSFAGPGEPLEEIVSVVPLEFRPLTPEELKQMGADGICSMLPDANVLEGDLVVFRDVRYVVTDVCSENCFGAVTHLTVKLEREYRKRQ